MPGFKVYDNHYPHFITITTFEWMPIFLSSPYLRLITDSLRFCQKEKGLQLHAYVIMPDHLHIVASSADDLPKTIGQLKSFTSHKIIDLLKQENKRLYLWQAQRGAQLQGEGSYKIWQDGFHPEQVHSREFFDQKLRYIHDNPVRKGHVALPADWLHSSAGYYYENRVGILDIEPIEW